MSSKSVHFAKDLTEKFDIVDEIDSDDEKVEEDDIVESEDDIFVNRLVSTFLEKYEHLNNFKNKSLIKNICKMAIKFIDKKDHDIEYYINFIESTIKEMRKTEKEKMKIY